MAPTRGFVLAFVLLIAACAAPKPPSSPTVSASPSTAVTSTSTPEPIFAAATVAPLPPTTPPSGAPEPRSLAKSATSEFGGVRLTLSIDLNPMYADQGAEALVTIDNRSRRTLEWGVDGCDINAGVSATTTGRWRDSIMEVPEELLGYRRELRRHLSLDDPIRLGFLRPIFVLNRNIGCSDLALPRELLPGRSVSQSFTWDGSAGAYGRLGPAPSGPVTITSRFERWKLAQGDVLRPLEVELDSWVLNGRRDEFLSPFEAIDAALQDERFTSWLLTRPVETNANEVVEYDRDLGVWIVGFVFHTEPTFSEVLHAAYVDSYTGDVFAVKESLLTP